MESRRRHRAPPGRTHLQEGFEAGAHPTNATEASLVAKRLVFHVGGYEPLSPEAMYRRFEREIRRFEKTWSASAAVTPAEIDVDGASWRVATTGPNWRVETECRLLRWDDILAAAAREPMWRRIPRGLLAFGDFIAGGALWGYFRTNWRYALFFLYPYLLLVALAALAALAGNLVAEAALSALAGVAAGALAFVVLLRWPGRRLYLPLMLDDWIFAQAYVRRGDPILDARLDRFAQMIAAAARAGGADEIVVIGHSLGAVLAADLAARALRLDPNLGQAGPRIVLLTIGSSLLKIGLHRAAGRLHVAVERVVAAPGVFWAEYQAITDVMNFYKTDPAVEMGVGDGRGPVIRIVRLSRMLDPAYYRRIKRNFFRLHRQFVSGNDRRATYDYFMLVCGPVPVECQVRSAEGAGTAIAKDGSLLPGEPHTPPGRAVQGGGA